MRLILQATGVIALFTGLYLIHHGLCAVVAGGFLLAASGDSNGSKQPPTSGR